MYCLSLSFQPVARSARLCAFVFVYEFSCIPVYDCLYGCLDVYVFHSSFRYFSRRICSYAQYFEHAQIPIQATR